MVRFSTKRLLVSTALIAVGISAILWAVQIFDTLRAFDEQGVWRERLIVINWLVGGVLIGAGLFAPFRIPLIGALFGLIIQGCLLIAGIFYLSLLNQI